MIPSPLVVGHRGAAGLAPENTLASFRSALEAGTDWVEFDVRFSRDGVPVVFHDATVDRTTDGAGRVRDQDLARLARLDAGGWFAPRFRGERVPALREVLEVLSGRAGADIEIKETGTDRAAAVGRVLEEVAASKVRPYLVSSFDPEAVAHAARFGAPAGLLVRPRLRGALSLARRLGAGTLVFSTRQATERRAGRARDAHLSAWVYTINERRLFERAARWGFEAVITDRPDLLRRWSEEIGGARERRI